MGNLMEHLAFAAVAAQMTSILIFVVSPSDVILAILIMAALIPYYIGVTFPDWDHPRTPIGKILKRHVKHRGHFHSIAAAFIFAAPWAAGVLLHFYLIILPVAAFFGVVNHLVCDFVFDSPRTRKSSARSLKFW
ncbi:MAG: metal-dependent hydrolase [Promethearchaeota archaeon]|nr:MAG: LexA-binding, inner membrane-associated putative hydrolase [Helarchaeota virus Nidhogg Meg22_1012]URC17372.1 MAG: LexA-binding, inner membrane-associated putative hydrolase [Helarchaeota virus Nidhogg Meg22_1214]